MDSRIVITGMGVVTPIGATVESFWEANLAGRSGLVAEDRIDVSGLPCGRVSGVIPEALKQRVRARWGAPGRSWSDTIMHCAVDQALTDAGVTGPLARPAGLVWSRVWPGPSGSDPRDYAVHLKEVAACRTAIGDDPAAVAAYLDGRPLPPEPTDVSAFPREVSERLGVPLVTTRLEATCSGGLRAIAEAARLLRLGTVDVVVVTAAVSRSTPYVLSQYNQLMALSRWKGDPAQASMPFDRRRSGMVINESAGALVLETAEHAARRGVDGVHAVVGGWGLAVDTTHITAPQVETVERVIRTALERSGTGPAGIDSVNAHGTSTRLNDLTEARALHRVFGERMAELDVCAVKSLTGHGSAASGIVESVVAALTLCRGIVPPVVTCVEPDPECAVRTNPRPVERPVRTVLKNSFGFGGQYASMVFHRPADPRPPRPAAAARG
ncbi:beta-ketoacyl-[acyl-carrier-protein] synthase family protein [Kitasatospora sp. NPDC052868]|uniref:beta-ketoacyl-[acyl-carrier-protein] synthase family protein n=1 Tax=Kitasatospora sp. NPDC052868 TaxID=3364060 RepID=UPI0037CC1F2E